MFWLRSIKVKIAGFLSSKKKKTKQIENNKLQKNYILCGNANTGKSTVFNALAHANAHIGNWLGVTVDVETKTCIRNDAIYNYFDLPGTASLEATSIDEQNAVNFLKEHKDFLVVNVCDLNNLRRNLYLTLELLEQGFKVTLLLNFKKSFFKLGGKVNLEKLSKELGIPIVLFNGKKTQLIEGNSVHMHSFSCAHDRHKKIDEILKNCDYVTPHKAYGTNKLDKFLLNKFFAIPCFFLTMAVIFFLTFVLVSKLFEVPLGYVFSWLDKGSANGFYQLVIFESLKIILNFLPQIITILLCINILENSGYISRLAFTFEDIFEKFGLNGKSIFPILMSLGCASIATPFSKGIADKNIRLKTASILSLFPCSAKLPIIVLFLSTLTKTYLAFYISLIYAACIIIALAFCLLLNRKYKSEPSNLILEFPALRFVSFKQVLKNIFDSLKSLISRILFVIVVVNVILFCLTKLNLITFLTIIPFALLSIFGFNLEAVSALVSGIVGKELIATGLSNVVLTQIFTPAALILFLIFALFYTPCFSTTGLLVEQFGAKQTFKILGFQFAFSYVLTCLVALILMPKQFVSFLIAITVVASIFVLIKLISLLKLNKMSKNGTLKLCNQNSCKKCNHNSCNNR